MASLHIKSLLSMSTRPLLEALMPICLLPQALMPIQSLPEALTATRSFQVTAMDTRPILEALLAVRPLMDMMSNSEESNEEENANDPERIEAEKRLEIENTILSPEWRKLYLSVPLGRLPNAVICKELAPPELQNLATVPFTEIPYKPLKATTASTSSDPASMPSSAASMPSSAASAPSDTIPAPSAATSFQPATNSKKPSSEKQTLRTNSMNLFCYQKVGHTITGNGVPWTSQQQYSAELLLTAKMDAEQAARRAVESAVVEADEYDYLQDPDSDQFTGPHQIPIKASRSPPALTNRLRAETPAFRAMIQLNVEKAVAQRKEAGANNSSISSAQNVIALNYWKLDA
ncbi:hypothetical protein BGZ47_009383 [Haplosporangium gracile]|nr:hypothetical protein BGZ47_009383 [Haplosporangium gracile]